MKLNENFDMKNYIKYLKLGMNQLVIIINVDLFDIDLFFDKVEMFYEIVQLLSLRNVLF